MFLFGKKNTDNTPFDPLKYLAQKHSEAESTDNGLFFRGYDLSLIAINKGVQQINGKYSVQMIFVLTHPFFEEELVESTAGFGNSPDDAVKMAVESFDAAVLYFTLAALKCTGDEEITSSAGRHSMRFRVPDLRPMVHLGQGNRERSDMWTALRDDISLYLGRKKAYWIKLYCGWTGAEMIAEARINNIVYGDLTEKLKSISQVPPAGTGFYYDKQFVLLIQKDDTYIPCPYTKADVKRLTYDALDRLIRVDGQESADKAVSEITSMGTYKTLGRELMSFIPEIYCSLILDNNTGDGIIADMGSTRYELKSSQLRSYTWMYDAVERYIRERHPDKNQNMGVLGFSSRYNAVYKAITNGAKIEDLVFTDIAYSFPEDHEVI